MSDLDGLATAIAASVDGVRACLILSRDGLIVGSHPADADASALQAWQRFAAVGDAERGFVQLTTETWCCLRRGAYVAFATCASTVRAGVVLDQMERILVVAEEQRADRSDVRAAAAPAPVAPNGKPRTSLHLERPPSEVPVLIAESEPTAPSTPDHSLEDAVVAAAAGVGTPEVVEQESEASVVPDAQPEPERRDNAAPAVAPASRTSVWATDQGGEADRIAITRELGELLQDDGPRADG